MKALHDHVRADLAGGVWGAWGEWVALRDRPALSIAVDLARRDVEHAAHIPGAGRLSDVQGAADVRLDEVSRIDERVGDRDLGPEVEDDFDPRQRARDRLGIAQIAVDDLDPVHLAGLEPVERPARAAGVVP